MVEISPTVSNLGHKKMRYYVTVSFRLIYTPISEESKSLFLRNHSKYDNMQYIIEKPYKMVTKNAKKNSNFSTFVRFLGPFLKKQHF